MAQETIRETDQPFYMVKSFSGMYTDVFFSLEEAKGFIDNLRREYQEGLIGNDGKPRLFEMKVIEY